MTRTHAALTAADVVLTIVGLAGLWAVKFAAMCWLVAGWALLSDRNASVFLGLFAAVTSLVVVHNAVTILGL